MWLSALQYKCFACIICPRNGGAHCGSWLSTTRWKAEVHIQAHGHLWHIRYYHFFFYWSAFHWSAEIKITLTVFIFDRGLVMGAMAWEDLKPPCNWLHRKRNTCLMSFIKSESTRKFELMDSDKCFRELIDFCSDCLQWLAEDTFSIFMMLSSKCSDLWSSDKFNFRVRFVVGVSASAVYVI